MNRMEALGSLLNPRFLDASPELMLRLSAGGRTVSVEIPRDGDPRVAEATVAGHSLQRTRQDPGGTTELWFSK